jgi:lipopolysaccharide export system permease protein
MKKRRNGMNLTIGIAVALVLSFDKIFGVLAEKSTFSPLYLVS